MNKKHREHIFKIKNMDCIACGQSAPSDAHHITKCGIRYRRHEGLEHYYTIPLCPMCHRFGKNSIASGTKSFERYWGKTQFEMLEEVWKILNFNIVDVE